MCMMRRWWPIGLLVVAAAATSVYCSAAGKPLGDSLPLPRRQGPLSLEAALARRRSVRRFAARSLAAEQIGQLCWAAQGVTEPASGKRTAPSAGALYPLELDVVTAAGVYRYAPGTHGLARRVDGDVRDRLSDAALGQQWVEDAPVVLVLSGVPARTQRKYGDRAERYVVPEAGHAAQNVLLQAEALDLAAVPVGAFQDDPVAKVLDLSRGERPLYLIPVGHPQQPNPTDREE